MAGVNGNLTTPLNVRTTTANNQRSTPIQVYCLHKMSPNTVKKCKNVLSTLIRLADEQSATVSKSVRNLVQCVIDDTMHAEEFTAKLQKELNSAPQPFLIPFLKENLPYLRLCLITKEFTIEGIRPPPASTMLPCPQSSNLQQGMTSEHRQIIEEIDEIPTKQEVEAKECMIATSSLDAATSLICAKPFVSQEQRNSQPSSDLMTSFVADGELENTHNLELVEWQIPGFSGQFTFLNNSGSKLYQSQSFCFAGAKWHLEMCGWRGDMSLKGIVSVNLFKEASASDCRISYSIGIKNSSGFVEWIRGTDTHCFEASGGKSKIFQFNKKLELLYREPVLVPAGVLTVLCALKNGDPHRVTSFMA